MDPPPARRSRFTICLVFLSFFSTTNLEILDAYLTRFFLCCCCYYSCKIEEGRNFKQLRTFFLFSFCFSLTLIYDGCCLFGLCFLCIVKREFVMILVLVI